MNRRNFLSTLFGATPLPLQIYRADEFTEKCFEHNEAWNNYFRELLGCSKEATDVSQCKPQFGNNNLRFFEKARETAKKLFNLKEKLL